MAGTATASVAASTGISDGKHKLRRHDEHLDVALARPVNVGASRAQPVHLQHSGEALHRHAAAAELQHQHCDVLKPQKTTQRP